MIYLIFPFPVILSDLIPKGILLTEAPSAVRYEIIDYQQISHFISDMIQDSAIPIIADE